MVEVGERRVPVPVNVQRDRKQLRHDGVVGDQRRQAGVDLQETLKQATVLLSLMDLGPTEIVGNWISVGRRTMDGDVDHKLYFKTV